MNELSPCLTFGDLVARVADYLGMAGEGRRKEITVPTDRAERALCERLVRDGWRRFIAASPHWSFFERPIELLLDPAGGAACVDADPARYAMPWYFNGDVTGTMTYAPGGPSKTVARTTESELSAMKLTSASVSGTPDVAVFRRRNWDEKRGQRPRVGWEAEVYPAPTTAATLIIPIRAYPSQLWGLADMHAAGPEYDRAVEAACMAEAEMYQEKAQGLRWRDWEASLAEATRINTKTKPRRLGTLADTSPTAERLARPFSSFTYQGVPIS